MRSMRGSFANVSFPLPSVTPALQDVSAAADVLVARAAGNPAGGNQSANVAVMPSRMSGGMFFPRMSGGNYLADGGGVTDSLGGVMDWVKANPLMAGGIAVAALMLFRGGRRR